MKREQVAIYLGLSDKQLKTLFAAGLIRSQGRGLGRRYSAPDVCAVSLLWDRLRTLLPTLAEADAGEEAEE